MKMKKLDKLIVGSFIVTEGITIFVLNLTGLLIIFKVIT